MSTIPSIGKRAKGTKAVTATGTASVAHQAPIRRNRAAVACASADKPSGAGEAITKKARKMPRKKPKFSLKKINYFSSKL